MNLKSLSKWQLLVLLLLIFQSNRFANADDEGDDKGNIFKKKKSPPKESKIGEEALKAVRDYLDLLCINWNGFFYSLGSDTPHTTQVLVTYLQQVSTAYARVLQLHNYNADEVSRTILRQFLDYIVPRMRDVTRFTIDSPIRGGPTVVEYSLREQRIVTIERLRRQRWTHPSNDRPRQSPPNDADVPAHELERIIFLRVPFPDPPPADRPLRPWGDVWQKITDPNHPENWRNINLRTDLTWNHLVPYAEVRYLLESFNRLWLRDNLGNVWYSRAMLLRLEIRLATLVILRADLEMNVPDAAEILRSDNYYIERAMAYNVWSAGNLFIGPRDEIRDPAPAKEGPDRFEMQAALVYRSEEWAIAGYRLTRDIQNFKKLPKNKQTLRELLNLYRRYVRLLQDSGSDELWVKTGQGVPPANSSHYDIHENSPNRNILRHFENLVRNDVRRNEQRILVSREYERYRRNSVPDVTINNIIDEELKPGGGLYKQLEAIRKEKLDKKIDDYFAQIKVSRFIFSGPKNSSSWTTMQDTSVCVGKKLHLDIKICDSNILFDPNRPSTSSGGGSSGGYSPGSPDVFFNFNNLKIVEHDSGIESGSSSRRQSDDDPACGATRDHRNMLMDPSMISNPPPDFSSANEAHDIDEDFYEDTEESLQDAALDRCVARKDPEGHRRKKRHSPTCTKQIIKDAWKQCKKGIKV